MQYSILIYQPDAYFNAARDDESSGALGAPITSSLADAGVYLGSGV